MSSSGLSREITLSISLLPPISTGASHKGKSLQTPFWEDFVLMISKQEITKIVSLLKMAEIDAGVLIHLRIEKKNINTVELQWLEH